MNRPVEIFFSYAHEDEALMDAVRRQLVVFERAGRILKWHDREIPPGTDWEGQIDDRLQRAHVILLFVSPSFIESRYCYDVEVVAALGRHEDGTARVIPVILRPCAWEAAPFASLQALPQDAKPVTQWPDQDQVCLDVARSVMTVVDAIAAEERPPPGGQPRPGDVKNVERKVLDGDRIPRLMVRFAPPHGVNVPPGYQPRLTQIAAQVVRDAATRTDSGQFSYPAQFRGSVPAVSSFMEEVKSSGDLREMGHEELESHMEIWFEYSGALSPDDMRAHARAKELEVVHCGVTLFVSPVSP
jgi:hypothetical protein